MGGSASGRRSNEEEEEEAWEGGPAPTCSEEVLWEGGPIRRRMLGKEARPQLAGKKRVQVLAGPKLADRNVGKNKEEEASEGGPWKEKV